MMGRKKLIDRFKDDVCTLCPGEPLCYIDEKCCGKFEEYKGKLGIKTNNPKGRPRMGDEEKRKAVSLRLKPETIEWLRRKAEEQGISQAELIDRMAK